MARADLGSSHYRNAQCDAALPSESDAPGPRVGDRTVKRFTIDKISGGMARVSYGVGLPRYDQHGQPWTREGGHWRYDAC